MASQAACAGHAGAVTSEPSAMASAMPIDDIGPAGDFDLGSAGRIGAHAFARDHASGGQQLRGMADGGDGFLLAREMADGIEHLRIQPQVFGRAAAGEHQGVIVFRHAPHRTRRSA